VQHALLVDHNGTVQKVMGCALIEHPRLDLRVVDQDVLVLQLPMGLRSTTDRKSATVCSARLYISSSTVSLNVQVHHLLLTAAGIHLHAVLLPQPEDARYCLRAQQGVSGRRAASGVQSEKQRLWAFMCLMHITRGLTGHATAERFACIGTEVLLQRVTLIGAGECAYESHLEPLIRSMRSVGLHAWIALLQLGPCCGLLVCNPSARQHSVSTL
jgi:hypothetical protein